jgi:hypothetical protein
MTTTRRVITLPTTRECTDCNGTGRVDPTEVLDINDKEAVLRELASSAKLDNSPLVGLQATDPHERIRSAVRVGFLASRLAWLETCALLKERPMRCGNCRQPGLTCSWSQNPAGGEGDCCADCSHT